MTKRKNKTEPVPHDSVPPELAALIEQDAGVGLHDHMPIVRTLPAEEAQRNRARISLTGADIEAVRRGDHGAPLDRLAGRLAEGWIEAAWGGDPLKLHAWEVVELPAAKLSFSRQQSQSLKRRATQAGISIDEMKREILKYAVIRAIEEDNKPVFKSLAWAIFGETAPEGARAVIGKLKPGEIDEFDVYVTWFHHHALRLAEAFLSARRRSQDSPLTDAVSMSTATGEDRQNEFLQVQEFADLVLDAIDEEREFARAIAALTPELRRRVEACDPERRLPVALALPLLLPNQQKTLLDLVQRNVVNARGKRTTLPREMTTLKRIAKRLSRMPA